MLKLFIAVAALFSICGCSVGTPTLPQCARVSTSYGEFIVCAESADASVTPVPEASLEASVDASVDQGVPDGGDDVRGETSVDAAVSDARVDAPKDATRDAAFDTTADTTSVPPANSDAGHSGFFTVGAKLFDSNGVEFRPRGVNHLHFDSPSVGIAKSGANVERWVKSGTASTDVGLARKSASSRMVPIVGDWDGTCDESSATLTVMVDRWVAQASSFKPLERTAMINIANEWGPANSTAWRDAYMTAIGRMRAAGYLGTLVVDSGGCGQDRDDVVKYGPAVVAADPQHNILFDVHVYGFWCVRSNTSGCDLSWQFELGPSLDALRGAGVPVVIGEFGPGRNIGPSATDLTPTQVAQAADARGFGWIAWAWDDPAGEFTSPPVDNWFALSATGDDRSPADLTTFGKELVPLLTGAKATVF